MGITKMYSIDSARLKRRIAEKGLTQPKVAAALGIAYQALNRGINEGCLSDMKLKRICALLDTDIDYICGATDDDYGYHQHKKPKAFNTPDDFEKAWMNSGNGLVLKKEHATHGTEAVSIRSLNYMPVPDLLDFIVKQCGSLPLYDAIRRHEQ